MAYRLLLSYRSNERNDSMSPPSSDSWKEEMTYRILLLLKLFTVCHSKFCFLIYILESLQFIYSQANKLIYPLLSVVVD